MENPLKNRYSDYSNADLLKIINDTAGYTPEAIAAASEVIRSRGGKEKLQEDLKKEQLYNNEILAVQANAYRHLQAGYQEGDLKSFIKSELLSNSEMNNALQPVIEKWKAEQENKKITPWTLGGGVLGGLLGGIIGGILWGLMRIASDRIFFIFALGVMGVSYGFVRFFTKKSKENIAVLILTALSVFFAFAFGEIMAEIYFAIQ